MLNIRDLHTEFQVGDKILRAVDGIDLSVASGQIVGLVGESGSGKSVTAASILRLLPENTRNIRGEIIFDGEDILKKSEAELRAIRGRQIALIFQNPQAAFNPVFTIGNQLIETIQLHQGLSRLASRDLAISLLHQVQISDPERRLNQYPHECSIGMCQRMMIAMALSMRPKLLIADEPTASLDVTIQAQIVSLLKSINAASGMSILMISHDLGVISNLCDYLYVMYLGKIVEAGPTAAVLRNPQHPYTQALVGSILKIDVAMNPVALLGEIPSPLDLPSGCRFHPRCPVAKAACSQMLPPFYAVSDSNLGLHSAGCILLSDATVIPAVPVIPAEAGIQS